MSYKSSLLNDSDSSMFTANSDTLNADDSSFDMSGNLTDITGDLTKQQGDKNENVDSNNRSGSNSHEDSLFGSVGGKYKSPPTKATGGNAAKETINLISNEKDGEGGDSANNAEGHWKRKRLNSDDSVVVVTDDSVNSGELSDLDTSIDDGTDTSNEKKKENKTGPESTLVDMKIANIDDNLPYTVSLIKTPAGGKVYIVGTAHFSEESQNDVSKIIQSVRPHIVVVELCEQRINILQLDEKTILEEAKNIDFQKMKFTIQQNGLLNGLMYLLLLNMSATITKELGIAPGGEFRRAFLEVKNLPHCIVHLGDRPIHVTMHRALSALSWWQTLRLGWHLLSSKDISKEDVERVKQQDLLKELLGEIAGEFPALERVFVRERDVYLTHSLQEAASSDAGEPIRVVGVVGIGHVEGILENWGKVTSSQIPPIMRIPPPTLSSRIFKFTFKSACIISVVYAGYKLMPKKWLP